MQRSFALRAALAALPLLWADPASAQHAYMSPAGECGFDLEDRGFYTFEDFQYFKPPPADIRTPRHSARVYKAEPLPFSGGVAGVDSTDTDIFFDGSFGETFQFIGWNLEPGDISNCMRAAGITTFIQASAHVLIDTNLSSRPVMNTDYRLGFGLAGRPLRIFRPLSFKVHLFHESSHIGDEYVLEASEVPGFRRWNISYEAVEALLAVDHFDDGEWWGWPAYMRVYGGGRRLTSFFDISEPWKGGFEEYVTRDTFGQRPLLVASDWETQAGAEFYLRAWEADHLGHGHFFKWQYTMAAVDLQRTSLLDVATPTQMWSTHAMLALVWGDYFNARSSNQLAAEWYRGVNPHGQFRNSELDYWALSLTIRF